MRVIPRVPGARTLDLLSSLAKATRNSLQLWCIIYEYKPCYAYRGKEDKEIDRDPPRIYRRVEDVVIFHRLGLKKWLISGVSQV